MNVNSKSSDTIPSSKALKKPTNAHRIIKGPEWKDNWKLCVPEYVVTPVLRVCVTKPWIFSLLMIFQYFSFLNHGWFQSPASEVSDNKLLTLTLPIVSGILIIQYSSLVWHSHYAEQHVFFTLFSYFSTTYSCRVCYDQHLSFCISFILWQEFYSDTCL